MKKINILITLLLFLIHPLFSQEYSRTFGRISNDEWKLTSYEKDPKAEAVVLFDIGDSYFIDEEGGFDIHLTRTRRIKILDRSGTDHAEVVIPFYVDGYGKTEIVESIKAFTHNSENFKITKKAVEPKAIYEEKISEHWYAKKFVFPDVKEGSIIEYQYELQTPFLFNLPDWEFQCNIPTVYSEYKTKLIPFYEYIFIAQGINSFSEHTSVEDRGIKRRFAGLEYNNMIHTFVMKDVPAFRDEAYISSADDYLMKIDFQLAKIHQPTGGTKEIISTWPKMNESLMKHDNFGKYIKKCAKPAKTILETELNLEGKTKMEKAKLIIDYVKTKFSWDGYYAKYVSQRPKELIAKKSGNTAEINLFMIALLKEADISAFPVILSTRNHGKVYTQYPFSHFFNYVIPLIDLGKVSFLADGTEAQLPFDKIPPRCINDQGLMVKSGEPTWISLKYKGKATIQKTINLNIDPDALTAKGGVSVLTTDLESFYYRNKFHNDTTKLKEEFQKKSFEHIGRIQTRNYEKESKPYSISFEGDLPIEKFDEKIVVSPFLHFPIQKNKLTQQERTYPVDFVYQTTNLLKSIVNIPENMEIVSLPKPYQEDNDMVEIKVTYVKTEKGIEANGKYRFKKAVYDQKDYSRLKYYMDRIVKSFNKQIVLKKI